MHGFVKLLGTRIFILFLLGCGGFGVCAENMPKLIWGRSIVKVMADAKNERVSMGSGVVVEPNRVATNCHVTRSAQSIIVSKGVRRHKVIAQSADTTKDVCILHTKFLGLPKAKLGTAANTKIGQSVFVFGFPHAVGLGMVRGVISARHPYKSSWIVETDAGFMHGTSGGALFDLHGHLIGLPTFMKKNKSGGQFYAVPTVWISQTVKLEPHVVSPLRGRAFWETETLFQDHTTDLVPNHKPERLKSLKYSTEPNP